MPKSEFHPDNQVAKYSIRFSLLLFAYLHQHRLVYLASGRLDLKCSFANQKSIYHRNGKDVFDANEPQNNRHRDEPPHSGYKISEKFFYLENDSHSNL